MVALAAGDGERHHHPLALLERAGRSGLDDLAHEFVAEDVARLHRRDVAIVEVQVRAADGGRGDADDRVARIEDFGIVDRIAADVVLAVPCQRFHADCSSMLPGFGLVLAALVALAAVARRSGDFAGFHQLLEAVQVAPRLDARLALEQLGDDLADGAGGRIIGDRRAHDGAARSGVLEPDAPRVGDVGAFGRLPGELLRRGCRW